MRTTGGKGSLVKPSIYLINKVLTEVYEGYIVPSDSWTLVINALSVTDLTLLSWSHKAVIAQLPYGISFWVLHKLLKKQPRAWFSKVQHILCSFIFPNYCINPNVRTFKLFWNNTYCIFPWVCCSKCSNQIICEVFQSAMSRRLKKNKVLVVMESVRVSWMHCLEQR